MGSPRLCPFSTTSDPDIQNSTKDTLPIWYHDKKHSLQKVSDDPVKFFTDDLDVSRLDRIQRSFIGLCLTSRYKSVARSLHRQLMMDRRIIVTEQADIHLTWDHDGIYIKPLPAYLLNSDVWTNYLCLSPILYRSACGFLLSYIWLITRESDFHLAITHQPPLLPPLNQTWTWSTWRSLVADLSHTINIDSREAVSPRYTYGELRLDRLNQIHRFSPSMLFSKDHALMRGYHHRYHNYGAFFEHNFSGLIVIFAYVSIVLSAMQVGLASPRLDSSTAFQNVAYGFAVFAIVVPVVVVGLMLALFVSLLVSNALATVRHWVKHRRRPPAVLEASKG